MKQNSYHYHLLRNNTALESRNLSHLVESRKADMVSKMLDDIFEILNIHCLQKIKL